MGIEPQIFGKLTPDIWNIAENMPNIFKNIKKISKMSRKCPKTCPNNIGKTKLKNPENMTKDGRT